MYRHMQLFTLPVLSILSLVLAACGPSIEMPQGTSKGYTSARSAAAVAQAIAGFFR